MTVCPRKKEHDNVWNHIKGILTDQNTGIPRRAKIKI